MIGQAAALRDPDELTVRAAEYPGHELWREITLDHARYFARGRDLTVHPYLVVTDSLEEMRAALAPARRTRPA